MKSHFVKIFYSHNPPSLPSSQAATILNFLHLPPCQQPTPASKIYKTYTLYLRMMKTFSFENKKGGGQDCLGAEMIGWCSNPRQSPRTNTRVGTINRNRQGYKVPQEVMEQLLEVDQPNISLSVPVNGSYPCIFGWSTSSNCFITSCGTLYLYTYIEVIPASLGLGGEGYQPPRYTLILFYSRIISFITEPYPI